MKQQRRNGVAAVVTVLCIGTLITKVQSELRENPQTHMSTPAHQRTHNEPTLGPDLPYTPLPVRSSFGDSAYTPLPIRRSLEKQPTSSLDQPYDSWYVKDREVKIGTKMFYWEQLHSPGPGFGCTTPREEKQKD